MSVDRTKIVVMNRPGIQQWRLHANSWPDWRELPLSPSVVKAGADDLVARFGLFGPQSHIYSHAKTHGTSSAIEQLGLRKDLPVVTAFTSSLDERVATNAFLRGFGLPAPSIRETFPDQITWLTALRDFASATPSIQFVIRVHPREGVTRREGHSSEHLAQLRSRFRSTPTNFTIVWPENPISSYDLAECSAVALISWSSIGVELARLGIPVIATTLGIGPFPDDDFLVAAPSEAQYFQLLTRSVDNQPALERIARAFRWYAMYFLSLSVDVHDVIPAFDYTRFVRPRPSHSSPLLASLLTGKEDVAQVNLTRLRSAQGPSASSDEGAALRRELHRLIGVMLTGVDPPPTAQAMQLSADGPNVHWEINGEPRQRIAPALSRLVSAVNNDTE